MYSLTIRDFLRCQHSLPGKVFGEAQELHFMTYEVETEYQTESLDQHHLVVDFSIAQMTLLEILRPLNFNNLDKMPQFRNVLTTTEYLCKLIHDQLSTRISSVFNGILKVTLKESSIAWAAYVAPVKKHT